ncbi:gephyrin-like molybdotransferase Glp [Neoactinobaculum massilliense]|uniref:molybdopterin molybdotransferase MoeA n=1 Tax=Neoactinobaculum massilliense TaxID=2364794 RepID=UPI000F524327|nr:gephyrin-like molybdotransferase Glp [Neoactinobaculum massilliense]
MRTVAQQLKETLDVAQPLDRFSVTLSEAVGCILAEDVRSTVDVPPADLALMDGYAVEADATFGADTAPVTLPVTEEVFASTRDVVALTPGTAIRVASGSRLPRGADAVVPLADTDQDNVTVTVFSRVAPGDNVSTRASDLEAGAVILRAGPRLSSRHIAALAAAGRANVGVRPAPRVGGMAIGDELVEPGGALAAGDVYDANSHALACAARSAGAVVYRVGAVSDEKNALRDAIQDQLVRADVIITTGGLSYGGGDTVKEVLAPLGSVRFDAVAMEPGNQIGVGTVGEEPEKAIIICLPGNPVAAMVAFEAFVRPALRNMSGYRHVTPRSIRAAAASGFLSPEDREQFVRVNVYGDPRRGYEFEAVGDAAQSSLAALAASNGLAIVPAGVDQVSVGDELECMILNG